MDKSYSQFERGERVDQPDMMNVAEDAHRNALAQLISEVILGQDGSPVILWGFDISTSSPDVTVTRGAAIVGFHDKGVTYPGMVFAGGAPSKTQNISSLPDGTYGVFVRLSMRPGRVRNRRAWDVNGAKEVARLMPTRKIEDWDLVFDRGNPGSEFLQIGNGMVMSSGVITTPPTVFGSRLFDSLRTNRVLTNADWGTAADRDKTDSVGLRGLVRWAKMVNRQIQDIVGGDFFGTNPKGGLTDGTGARSLTQLNDEKLNRNGSTTVTGDIVPDADGTRRLGTASPLNRFFLVYAKNLYASLEVRVLAGLLNLYGSNPEIIFRGDDADLDLQSTITDDGTNVTWAVGNSTFRNVFFKFLSLSLRNAQVKWSNVSTGATGANPLPNAAGMHNVLTPKNIIKCWATVQGDGTAHTVSVLDGFNIASAVAAGGGNDRITVTLTDALGDDTGAVLATMSGAEIMGNNFYVQVGSITSSSFYVQVVDGGTGLPIDHLNANFKFSFAVLGVQS